MKDDLMWLEIETDLMWVVVVGVEGESRDSSSKSLSINRNPVHYIYKIYNL